MKSGVMFAALSSGSGKTSITCGLLRELKDRNMKIAAFKCGPDYIDPMFHREVLGIASHNLDTFFLGEKEVRSLYRQCQKGKDISVIEGVMGLYDGLGGIRMEGSSYHLASCLEVPIVLVVDAHGMGKTLVSILAGVLSYDESKLIKGIILNRTTKTFYSVIAPEIERELGIKCLGFVPKISDIGIESRHLGLKLPEELEDLDEKTRRLADCLVKSVDVDGIIELSQTCDIKTDKETNESSEAKAEYTENTAYDEAESGVNYSQRLRIAVARDRAFCFYYEENLELLKSLGADIVEFSPLKDSTLPENIDGIILGGGYPELFAKELCDNLTMRQGIKQAIDRGLPSLAECGGFMYLQEYLTTKEGENFEMVGAIEGGSTYTGKLVRFGYIDIVEPNAEYVSGIEKEREDSFLRGNRIKAHEFHYFDSTNNGGSCLATKPTTGKQYNCIVAGENHFWGYPHLYYLSCPEFVRNFIKACLKYKEKSRL